MVITLDNIGHGLYMSRPGSDVALHRHDAHSPPGLWTASVSLSAAAAAVLGQHVFDRPAVVDCFGSLVFVGPAQ